MYLTLKQIKVLALVGLGGQENGLDKLTASLIKLKAWTKTRLMREHQYIFTII